MALLLEIDVKDKGSPVIKKFSDTSVKQVKGVEKVTKGSTAKMSQSFKGVSQAVSAMRMQMLLVTGAIIAVGVAIGKVVNDTAQYRDDIMKLSNATGIATDSLAGFQYAVQIGGQSAETFDRGIKALLRSMQGVKDGLTESQRAFDQLGINVLDVNGNMRAGEEVFLDTAESLKNMTNDTERAALAQRIFGKAGIDLLPTLNMGRAGIEELQKKAKSLGLTFDREAGKAAEDYNDRMLDLKSASKGLSMVMGELLIPGLTETATNLTNGAVAAAGFTKALKDKLTWQLLASEVGIKSMGIAIADALLNNIPVSQAWMNAISINAEEVRDKMNELEEQAKSLSDAGGDGPAPLSFQIPDADFGIADRLKAQSEASDKELQIFRDAIKEKAALQQAAFETRIETEEAETEAIIEEYANRLNQEMELDIKRTEGQAEETEKRKLIKEGELQASQNITSIMGSLLTIATANSKKASDAQKLVSIANTGVSTYAAAQKAFESQIIIGDPTSPIRGAVAAAAAVAAGLARISQMASFQRGGVIGGQSDAVPILGHRGEGVVNRRGMDSLGERGLRNLNQGRSVGGNTIQLVLPNVTNITDETVRLEIIPRLQRAIEDDGVQLNA